ncbi:MAG: hypothetical protein AAGJ97_07245, partial [Planctomycetota bacterium]
PVDRTAYRTPCQHSQIGSCGDDGCVVSSTTGVSAGRRGPVAAILVCSTRCEGGIGVSQLETLWTSQPAFR